MKSALLKFNNTTLRFQTNFDKYFAYFATYFSQISEDDSEERPADIDITFDHSEGSLNNKIQSVLNEDNFEKIGANTYVSNGRLLTIRKIDRRWKLLYDVTLLEGRLLVKISLVKKPAKDFFRYGPMAKEQHEWFFNATYYLMYYPLFWFLAHQKCLFPLHASAFNFHNKGVVVCGLEGIGKTSLGLKFLQEEGSEFLSDNLIFFGRDGVQPCYELVRMHADDDKALWQDSFERINSFNILKDFFRPKFMPRREVLRADKLIFPEFGKEFSIQGISVKEAAERAVTLSYLPSELNHYREFCYLFNLLDEAKDVQSDQIEVLQDMLKEASCWRVIMPKEDGLDANFEKLKEKMS